MKKLILLSLIAILSTSCKGQENQNDTAKNDTDKITEAPKGSWKVDKEYDEEGNLIRYDSIYSWSSTDAFSELAEKNPDSLIQSFQSRFYRNFSGVNHPKFGHLFENDSLFTNHFFTDDFFDSEFGKDFMDLDRVRERMEKMQKNFLKKYESEFDSLKEEKDKQ